jgi:hypothetical protein
MILSVSQLTQEPILDIPHSHCGVEMPMPSPSGADH